MTNRVWGVIVATAALAAYEVCACTVGTVPTITHIVHETRLHFRPARPHCDGCTCVVVRPLVPRRPAYRGYSSSVPS